MFVSLFILIAKPGAVGARVFGSKLVRTPSVLQNQNSQTMSLLEGHLNANPNAAAGKQLAIVDNSALLPDEPSGEAYIDSGVSGTGQISTYTVRDGDTLSSVAKMFGVSTNTVRWANDLSSGTLKVGQTLIILPVSGVKHTVVKGDTVQSIAKKYSADVGDILSYNGLATNATLTVGQVVIVPDGELGSTPTTSGTSGGSSSGGSSTSCGLKISNYERLLVNPCRYPSYPGYYANPLAGGGHKTQNLHGYNAVDLGAPMGTPIMAAADGTVIIAKQGGYNGGYGSYVVISHGNGTQTLYAHMSQVYAAVGQSVTQGALIGTVGVSGKTTGPHVHFEVRGARNPF